MSNAKETTSYAATKSQTAAQLERSKRVSIATSVYSQHSQSTNDIPRITGNAPTHLQTWEQQNRVRINSGGALSTLYPAKPPTTTATTPSSNSGAARRILPSPASNKSQGENDRAARTVRQLLAKHQENINQTSTPGLDSKSSSPKNNPKTNQTNTAQSVGANVKGKTTPTSKLNQDNTNGHNHSTKSYLKKVQNIPNMPHQQPHQLASRQSPHRKYTLTDDVTSSSDEDESGRKGYRNENNVANLEAGVVSRGSNHVPGDSFPATAHQLHATSMADEIDDDEEDKRDANAINFKDGMEEFLANGSNEISDTEQELLRRLGQGQARMEQIKRMLVNQRGFIVESLKQLAVSNIVLGERQQNGQRDENGMTNDDNFSSKQSCANCQKSSYINSKENFERDRTLGRTITDFNSAAQNKQKLNGNVNAALDNDHTSTSRPNEILSETELANQNQVQPGVLGNLTINNGDPTDLTTSSTLYNGMRLCPMCEAAFPPNSVSQEDFELHVVEHFNFDEAETLRYIPPSSSSSSTADYSSGGGGGGIS